jgi:AcrR family transcriptional regulator
MARKLGITRDDVIETATRLADERGLSALGLSDVAAELRIRTPSLYHHVDGLPGLKRALALEAASRLRKTLSDAASGLRGREALIAVARAYRRFAHRHGGLLAATLPAPRRGEDEELYDALARVVQDIARFFLEAGVEGDDAVHAIRALRSYLHGFVDLERQRGFGMPQQLDTSFERGLLALLSCVVDA